MKMQKTINTAILSAIILSVLTLAGCASIPGTPYGQPCTSNDGRAGTQNIFGACFINR